MCDCGATCATKEGEASASASSSASSGLALATVEAQPASTPARVRSRARRIVRQLVPDEILKNEQLNKAIAVLNKNYDFEIHKTVWRIKKSGIKRVGLQFPEGLLMYSCAIADILEEFAGVEHTVILGDTTFGACCVDDFSAKAMECELLIHYGHSCLIPVDETSIPCMYIFVNMKIDLQHLVESVKLSFEPCTRIILAGTIQFNKEMHAAKKVFKEHFASVYVPQSKPLSSGEVLGCTAPCVSDKGDVIVFLADGRFHLEALMIANPTIPAYRYDPYGRVLTLEKYDHQDMRKVRRSAIERCKVLAAGAKSFGLVLGTLGRQGNPKILYRLEAILKEKRIPYVIVLMSEITPQKLKMFSDVEAWIQIACPRLSIDWAEGFNLPILSSYEGMIALEAVQPWWQTKQEHYRMDFYSVDAGPWGNKFDAKRYQEEQSQKV